MKKQMLLVAAMMMILLSSCEKPIDNSFEKKQFFSNKYYEENVFDCFRSPADPVAGSEWILDSFSSAYDAQAGLRTKIEWPEGGYLKFDIAEDTVTTSESSSSLIDDVNNTGLKYKIQLKLYTADGEFVRLISDYGKLGGFGDAGFFYEQENFFGTLFVNDGKNLGSSLVYTPKTGYITKLSELFDYLAQPIQ